MRQRIRSHLTYASVISTPRLFLLSGGRKALKRLARREVGAFSLAGVVFLLATAVALAGGFGVRRLKMTALTRGSRTSNLAFGGSITALALAVAAMLASSAAAAGLNPPPPPYTTCKSTGAGTICRLRSVLLAMVAAASLGLFAAPASAAVTAAKVSVGSPPDQTPRNHVNEPAVAIDAHNPDVLVAGSIDYIDQQPCPQNDATQTARCENIGGPGPEGAGFVGVYFSFDRGKTWAQPTYSGWTRSDCASADPCVGHFGPIGTLPWYYEAGLVSDGDPGVAIGRVL